MLAFHGALTTVDYVDDGRRRRLKLATDLPSVTDRCAGDDVGGRWTTRARSVPPDALCRRLVSRGTQTSTLAEYIGATAATAPDDAWLRRVDALDLSFPVASRHAELRGFLADTLALVDRKQVPAAATAAAVVSRTPTMRRRRWAACDLRVDDEPAANSQPPTALDDDPDDWTDDGDDEGEILSGGCGADCAARPHWTPVCSAAAATATKTRPHLRPGCRTVSRHPAPNMPMIREDERTSSADDDDDRATGDVPTADRHRAPPAAPRSPPPSLPKTSAWTRRGPSSAAGMELSGSCCRRLVETLTNDDELTRPTFTSPSLLDAMHKKYCAVQYVRRRERPSTPGYHGNAHLSHAADRTTSSRQTDANRDQLATVGDTIATRQAGVARRVSGSHATSRQSDCDSMIGVAKTNACICTSPSVDITASLNASGFGEQEDEKSDDDDDDGDEGQREVLEQESGRFAELRDDKPWKKRFCDFCHGELEVKFLNSIPSSDGPLLLRPR